MARTKQSTGAAGPWVVFDGAKCKLNTKYLVGNGSTKETAEVKLCADGSFYTMRGLKLGFEPTHVCEHGVVPDVAVVDAAGGESD